MAQTTLGPGFVIDESARAQAAPDADDKPLTEEQELLLAIDKRLQQGFPKAAQAAAVELVNLITAKHDLGGGAYL